MSEFSQIGDKILQETLMLFQAHGIEVREMHPESGELAVKQQAKNNGDRLLAETALNIDKIRSCRWVPSIFMMRRSKRLYCWRHRSKPR